MTGRKEALEVLGRLFRCGIDLPPSATIAPGKALIVWKNDDARAFGLQASGRRSWDSHAICTLAARQAVLEACAAANIETVELAPQRIVVNLSEEQNHEAHAMLSMPGFASAAAKAANLGWSAMTVTIAGR